DHVVNETIALRVVQFPAGSQRVRRDDGLVDQLFIADFAHFACFSCGSYLKTWQTTGSENPAPEIGILLDVRVRFVFRKGIPGRARLLNGFHTSRKTLNGLDQWLQAFGDGLGEPFEL